MMNVVRKEGVLLEFASNKLKNDRKVVMAAVRNSGLALEFASNELKNDPKFVARIARSIEKKSSNKNYITIDENQILENTDLFYNSLISQSLFSLLYSMSFDLNIKLGRLLSFGSV